MALGKSQPCLPSGEEEGCPWPLPRVLSSWGSQALLFSLLPRTSSFTYWKTPWSHTRSPSELPSDRAYHCRVEEANFHVGEWYLRLVCRESQGCGWQCCEDRTKESRREQGHKAYLLANVVSGLRSGSLLPLSKTSSWLPPSTAILQSFWLPQGPLTVNP